MKSMTNSGIAKNGAAVTNGQPHRWGTIETAFATFAAWVDERGRLVRFNLSAKGAAKVDPEALHDERAIAHVRKQVEEYCAGARTDFDLELAPAGTQFQCAVWNALLEIPFGETCSYGDIARRIGQPKAARGVGSANHANPIALIVPCHRVIGFAWFAEPTPRAAFGWPILRAMSP